MEICGGQTHAIVRYGIDQLLPQEVSLVHGPGCPVCVTPVEYRRQGDRDRWPRQTSSCAPSATCCACREAVAICWRPRRAAPMSASSIRRWTRSRSPRRSRRANVVFFAVGFETTAPANAMAAYCAKREGMRNFSLLVSHVLVPPAISAILDAAGNRIQGFLAAGHVCTVMGTDEYQPLAERYRVPIVVTGFEPLDILEGVYLCVSQLEEGRAEVENQYSRAVRREGNRPAQRVMAEVFKVMSRRWRGIGDIAESGLGLADAYAELDAERRFGAVATEEKHESECISGLVLRGEQKPPRMPGLRHALHARASARRHHGVVGRGLRRLLPLSRRARRGGGTAMSEPRGFALACPAPAANDELVQLAQGGGGRAMAQFLDDIIRPALGDPELDRQHDGAVLALEGPVAFTTDCYVVRPLVFPGGDIGTLAINGTVNDLAMCGARPLYLSVGFILEEGLPLATLRAGRYFDA